MKLFLAMLGAVSYLLISAVTNAAQSEIVVTPQDQHGWSTDDTRPGGSVTFVVDMTAPSGVGALRLTTDALTIAKAQYMHDANVALSSVSELGYWTKQNIGSPPVADPSYQLAICANGVVGGPMPACNGFTTLVFEPYQGSSTPVVPGSWQEWDVDMGRFWSTRNFSCGMVTFLGTPGGPATYTLAEIQAACPNAVVVQYGVNIGTNNPLYDVETDLFDFNGTVYDFEPYHVVRNKDECKDGGWRSVVREDGSHFRNQGDCVSYANHNQ